MLSSSESLPTFSEHGLVGAAAVARGVTRMFARSDIVVQGEVGLRNGRRADLMGIAANGDIFLVEIKCSRADLIGDQKWGDYLDFCDRYFWAVPTEFDAHLLDGENFLPERSGVIVADAYDAEIIRPAARHPLAPARRKKECERLARLAMRRLAQRSDPELAALLQERDL